MMSALMSDLIEGTIDANTGNAICKAGGNLLKIAEMTHRHGKSQAQQQRRVLELVPLTGQATEPPAIQ